MALTQAELMEITIRMIQRVSEADIAIQDKSPLENAIKSQVQALLYLVALRVNQERVTTKSFFDD